MEKTNEFDVCPTERLLEDIETKRGGINAVQKVTGITRQTLEAYKRKKKMSFGSNVAVNYSKAFSDVDWNVIITGQKHYNEKRIEELEKELDLAKQREMQKDKELEDLRKKVVEKFLSKSFNQVGNLAPVKVERKREIKPINTKNISFDYTIHPTVLPTKPI